MRPLVVKEDKTIICSLSVLDRNTIDAIRSTEQKLDKTLLALSCNELEPAELTKEELDMIGAAEKQLGLVLAAVKSS